MNSPWQERLDFHLAKIPALRKINDKAAEARKKAEAEKLKLTQPELPIMKNHTLGTGDICTVLNGQHKDKTVLVTKPNLVTKYGPKAITYEYNNGEVGDKALWLAPDQLQFIGERDDETAQAVADADYAAWKARRDAGVPPASQFRQTKPFKRQAKKSVDGEGETGSGDIW